ncbi:MAG: hypothetical protein ACJ780_12180 [Solirubrobacteraceae bacterium]
MNGWRAYRPAIWLGMLGLALILLIEPPYLGAVVLGVAVGIAIRVRVARRRAARGLPPRRSGRR